MAQTISVKAQLIDEMSADIKKIQRTVEKSFGKVQKEAKQTSASLKNMSMVANTMRAAWVGVAGILAGKVVGAFIKAGSEMENLTTEFKVLLGTTEEAKKRMAELEKFAQTTPFQLSEVAKASKILETFTKGALSTGDALRMVGDAAAITGEKDFGGLAMWVGRAYDGLQNNRPVGEAMMRLQELALVSGDARAEIEKLQKAGRGKDAWLVLEGQLKKADGGMKALSQTVTGLQSTIKDQLSAAMRQMMQEGAWDQFALALKGISETLTDILKSGALVKLGQQISDLTLGFAEFVHITNITKKNEELASQWFRIGNEIKAASDNIKEAEANIANLQPGQLTTVDWFARLKEEQAKLEVLKKEAADLGADSIVGRADSATKSVEKKKKVNTEIVDAEKKRLEALKEQWDAEMAAQQQMDSMYEVIHDRRQERLAEDVQNTIKSNNAKRESDKKLAEDKARLAKLDERNTMNAIRMSNMALKSMFGDSKEMQGVLAGLAYMELMASTAVAIRNIWQDKSTGNYWSKAALSIATGAYMTAQAIGISRQIEGRGFQDGGVVPGSSTQGDRVPVRVNSGEMILNQRQQANLFNALDKGSMGGGVGTVVINNTFAEGMTSEDIDGFSVRTVERFRELYRYTKSTGQI